MVPTAGLEPAQVAPLAPQASASTNFATSAIHGLRPTRYGVRGRTPSTQRRCAPVRKTQKKRCHQQTPQRPQHRAGNKILSLTGYFAGAVGFGAAGAGAAG